MIRALILLLLPFAAQAETVRVATFNTELDRDGPGILLRDIRRDDPQVQAVVKVLVAAQADIVALQRIDWDLDGLALSALAAKLAEAGLDYPYQFAAQPNTGLDTGLDMDGDGRGQGPGDSHGWGRFTGHNGMAILSRHKIRHSEIRDFSNMHWKDLPGAKLPYIDGKPFPSEDAQRVQRLSSTAHWIVPIETPLGRVDLMTFHASPPVFDGPEDRNGLRNRDEIRFWTVLLDGDLGPAPQAPFIIAGDANLDPMQGDGHKQAIIDLLAHPLVQDPVPQDPTGDTSTVHWKAVGDMRVDYVLPSSDLSVLNAGIVRPQENSDLQDAAERASRHRLVWVDVAAP